jgi:putative selenium metabolism hydrolase
VLDFLRDLVRLESTPGREAKVVQRVVDEMHRLGYDEAYVDRAGNAVGRIGDGRGPVLLTDCHVDTIPLHASHEWRHDPLGAAIDGDRVYGLGVCDMKGSVAASVHGVGRLAGGGLRDGTVYVVCSIAEEMMEGAALRATVEACRPDAVIIGEPTDLRIHNGQRGRAKLQVEVRGRACHAAHPDAGINAVERMSELVLAVARIEQPPSPRLGPRSIACIDVHSEPYPSVSTVPGLCRARFDCRLGAGDTAESLVALVRDQGRAWSAAPDAPELVCQVFVAEFDTYVGDHFAVPEYAPAWYFPKTHPVVEAGLRALTSVGLEAEVGTYGFCTNGSLTAGMLGIPTIGFGVGEEHVAHTADEWIEVPRLYRAADGFAALARALLTTGRDQG